MALRWFPDKYTTESDYYGVALDKDWLDGQEIDNVQFSADESSGLNISSMSHDSITENGKVINRAYALFAGGVPGSHEVTITVNSTTRTRVIKIYLVIK